LQRNVGRLFEVIYCELAKVLFLVVLKHIVVVEELMSIAFTKK